MGLDTFMKKTESKPESKKAELDLEKEKCRICNHAYASFYPDGTPDLIFCYGNQQYRTDLLGSEGCKYIPGKLMIID